MHHQLAEHDHLALDSLGDLEQGADVPAPSLGKALADVTKLVETQEKAEVLQRPTRLPPWRDNLETCQPGAKSEKHLEHELSIQEGGEDTFVNVKMQHSEMCKKVEVASVEEGQENEKMKLEAVIEAKNEKSVENVVNELKKRGQRGPQ